MKIERYLVGPTRIPLISLRGDEPGEKVFVAAGIHGDEEVGPIVARRLARLVKIVRGELHIIPVANTHGSALGMRGVPTDGSLRGGMREGRDLNRVFPGKMNAQSGTASDIARLVYALVRSTGPTVVIDLHDWAGDPSTIFGIVDRPLNDRAQFVASQSMAFARKFGVPIVHDLPLKQYIAAGHDKSLTGALMNCAHIPAFTVELGDAPRKKNIAVGIAGVLNVLRHCNMLPEDAWVPRVVEIAPTGERARLQELCAPCAGVVTYCVLPGKLVLKGTRLVRIATHKGRVIELVSARAGIVFALGPRECKAQELLVTMAVLERR